MLSGNHLQPVPRAEAEDPLVVLLRGAPGVGKSTAARLLGASGAVGSVVEVDTLRRLAPGVQWGDRHLHAAALEAAALTARTFARSGFSPVLLVDCFGRDHASRTIRLIDDAEVTVAVVSLWAEPNVLGARLALRAADYADLGMALLINEEVRTRRVDDLVIDTSTLTADQVAAQLRVAIGERE